MDGESRSVVHSAAELGVGALAAVVERSRDGIVVVTADRRYVYANPAACRIMGYSLDELRALPDFLDNFPRREHRAMLEHSIPGGFRDDWPVDLHAAAGRWHRARDQVDEHVI